MRIESLNNLLGQFPDIDGHWDFDNLAQTENHIRAKLSHETENHSKTAELLTQLARVQGLLGNLTESGATLLLAKDLLSKDDSKSRTHVRFMIEQGRFFALSMSPGQSISFFLKAWELSLELKETFLSIEAAVLLSISQPPKSQNDWLQKVISLAEDTEDETAKLWLVYLYMMEGWHNFDFRKYDLALASFEKALSRPQSLHDTTRIQSIRWAIGRTHRALNQISEALDIQKGLLNELTTAGKVNGHVYLEMAECLQLNKNQKESAAYFELAYKELSLNGWYSDNKSSELSRIQYLSKKK